MLGLDLKLKSHRGQTLGREEVATPAIGLRFLRYVLLLRYAGRGRVSYSRGRASRGGSGKREPDHEGGEGSATTGRSVSASTNPRVAILKQPCGRRESGTQSGRK